MTLSETNAPALPSFGVLARFGEVFALAFRRRPGIFVGFNLLALGVLLALMFAVIALPSGAVLPDWVGAVFAFGVAIYYLFGAGVMAMAGCDEMAAAGERRSLGVYLRQTLRSLPALLVLGLVASILVALGFAVIGIVGLWAAAVFSVFVPVVVWEGAGWGGLGRSQRLTKEYRWPIVGLGVLVFLTLFVPSILALVVMTAVPGEVGGIVGGLLSGIGQLAGIPIFGALPPVIYARLRTAKESGGEHHLRRVFE